MKRSLLLLLLILVSTPNLYAHGGRLDSFGGHNVGKTKVTKGGLVFEKGTYHFHDLSKAYQYVTVVDDVLQIGPHVSIPLPVDQGPQAVEATIDRAFERYLKPYVVTRSTKVKLERARAKLKEEL